MKWTREQLQNLPSFQAYGNHIETIEDNLRFNPSLCIETCKSLIEGICKTILHNRNLQFASDISFQGLVRFTLEKILVAENGFESDLSEIGRRMASVAQALCKLRDNAGFASHGLDAQTPRLTENAAFLATRIADSISSFILRCYSNLRLIEFDGRLHYEDCSDFNEEFDSSNSLAIGIIELSASKVLFQNDYEAYKAEYYDYLEDQKRLLLESVE